MRRVSLLLGIAMVVAVAIVAGACASTGPERGEVATPTPLPSRPTPLPKTITVALAPSETSVRVGEAFTMSIVLDNPQEQPVIGADTFLNFDPAYLEVVGSDGKPASEITPGRILPVLLFNGANNGEGVITYSAGILGAERKDPSIPMATINFRAKKATAATKIEFSTAWGRNTEVAAAGYSLLAGVKGATVTIR